MMIPRALTIAGSDSGGGAGIQADLKTFLALGVHGSSVLTAITAQNTRATTGFWPCEPESVYEQYAAVMSDIGAQAGKTGMLATAGIVAAVARGLEAFPLEKLVVDPVMIAKSGAALLEADALPLFRERILPRAYLLTPNLPELEALTGETLWREADVERAGRALLERGARAVLIKGGHGGDENASDDLFLDAERRLVLPGRRIRTNCSHGTGCVLSAAVAALLARGEELFTAARKAKRFVTEALARAEAIGGGTSPVGHGWSIVPPKLDDG